MGRKGMLSGDACVGRLMAPVSRLPIPGSRFPVTVSWPPFGEGVAIQR